MALTYEVLEGWEQLPPGYEHRDVAGVAVDLEDRVFLICRGEHPIIMYDPSGKFLGSWGEGDFTYRTHGITVGPDNSVYCTDDGNHTVRKFTPEGKLLMTLGTMNEPSDTGYDGKDSVNIPRAAGPFNRPTNIAIGPKGDLYVSDGYGNCRVHQFAPNGELKRSWGTSGKGPGQFHLPHGIAVAADGRVFVCDRENDRIEIFSPDGEYVSEWTDTQRPTHIVFDDKGRAYVSELWWHKGQTSQRHGPITTPRPGRVSVFDMPPVSPEELMTSVLTAKTRPVRGHGAAGQRARPACPARPAAGRQRHQHRAGVVRRRGRRPRPDPQSHRRAHARLGRHHVLGVELR